MISQKVNKLMFFYLGCVLPAVCQSLALLYDYVYCRDSGDQMKSPSFVPRLDFEGGGGNENEVAVTASARTHEYNYRTWVEKSERRRVERDNKQRLNAQ